MWRIKLQETFIIKVGLHEFLEKSYSRKSAILKKKIFLAFFSIKTKKKYFFTIRNISCKKIINNIYYKYNINIFFLFYWIRGFYLIKINSFFPHSNFFFLILKRREAKKIFWGSKLYLWCVCLSVRLSAIFTQININCHKNSIKKIL